MSPIELDDTPRQNLAQPRRQLSFGRSAKLREGSMGTQEDFLRHIRGVDSPTPSTNFDPRQQFEVRPINVQQGTERETVVACLIQKSREMCGRHKQPQEDNDLTSISVIAKVIVATSVRVRNTPRDGVFSGGGTEKGRFPTSTFLTSVSGLLVLVFPPPSTGTRLQTCLPATTSWNPSSGARRLTSAPSHRCCVSAD